MDMFTGPYVIINRDNNFKPSIAGKGSFTIQFFEFISKKMGEPIRHRLYPDGEFSAFIRGKLYYADGFLERSDVRKRSLWLEFNTCGTHGCRKCYPDRKMLNTMVNTTYRFIGDLS